LAAVASFAASHDGQIICGGAIISAPTWRVGQDPGRIDYPVTGEIPKSLGRYEILSEIGRGMMGVVYQAKDPTLGRIVALKTINVSFAVSESERTLFEQRFMNEARLAAGLSHPNIVVVHDVGWDEGTRTPYIALEFLQGTNLSDMVPPPLDWREALRLIGRLAEALHVAHVQKIVHRDIKPANVMVLPSKEPKLMDFGIARAPASDLTAAGEFFGTPSYMSPEQATGEALDGRSDLFSLGAVLYFLLTGLRAFEGKSVPAILAKVERENPAAPSSVNAAIPHSVDLIVARMLEKKPEHRYQDGLQLAEDIDDALQDKPPRHATINATIHGDPTLVGAQRHAGAGATGHGVETRLLKALEGPRGLLAIAGLLALALIVSLVLPRGGAAPSPSPSGIAGSPTTGPSVAPIRPGSASPSPTDLAGGVPSPGASPSTSPSPDASATPAPARTARLTLAVEHSVKAGSMLVFVDQKPLLSKMLISQKTRKALIFKGRKGEVFETIDVAPGERTIRIDVQDGDDKKTGQTTGTFKRGETKLLEVKVGGGPRIELEWR
jgi:serine/threonine-protein kinase